MMRAEQSGAFRFLLIGGRALEVHGVVRFTKDVDFLVASGDLPALCAVLNTAGYRKTDENAIFSRWKHPSLTVDDVDVMYVRGPIRRRWIKRLWKPCLPNTGAVRIFPNSVIP